MIQVPTHFLHPPAPEQGVSSPAPAAPTEMLPGFWPGLPSLVPWALPWHFCAHDLTSEHSGLKRHQVWVWASTGAHLVPLPAHEQHTENIEHLQLVHDLVHDLHGLGQLCPCGGVGQSTLIWRLWKRWQRCETEAASAGKDLLQLLLLHWTLQMQEQHTSAGIFFLTKNSNVQEITNLNYMLEKKYSGNLFP